MKSNLTKESEDGAVKEIQFSPDEISAIEDYMSVISEDFIGDNLSDYNESKFAPFLWPDSGVTAWGYGAFREGQPLMDTLYFVFVPVEESIQVSMPNAVLEVSAYYAQIFQWALSAAQSAEATAVFCAKDMGADDEGGGLTQEAIKYIGLTDGEHPTGLPNQEPIYIQKTSQLFRETEREIYYPVSIESENDFWHLAVSAKGDTRDLGRTSIAPDYRESLGPVVLHSAIIKHKTDGGLRYVCSNLRLLTNSLIAATGNIETSQPLFGTICGLFCSVLESMGLQYDQLFPGKSNELILPVVLVKADGVLLQNDVEVDIFADIREWLNSGEVSSGLLSTDIDFALDCGVAPFTITPLT